MTDTPGTALEAVEHAIGMCRAHGLHGTEATLRALSAELAEMTRRRNRWKAIAEGQDFTRVYLETCAERDSLKAELAEAVEVVKFYGCEKNWITENPYEECSIDLDEGNCARAFLDRHQKGADT